jgi:hypothetical protein
MRVRCEPFSQSAMAAAGAWWPWLWTSRDWPVIVSSHEIGRRAASWAWVFLACLTALTIPAAVAPVIQLPGAQGVPFLVGFLMLWASLFYAMAFRAIYRLDLAEGELRWHSLLRAGVIPLGELRSIRPRGASKVVIESAGRRPLRVAARAGVWDFAAAVKRQALQVEVDLPGIAFGQGTAPAASGGRPQDPAPDGHRRVAAVRSARPSWPAIARMTALASLAGALLQAGLAASAAQPNPVGVYPGGAAALALLYRRGTGVPTMVVAVVVAAVSAGLLWLVFASVHATRWVAVADAVLCPLAAITTARLLTLARPQTRSGARDDEQA